MEWCRIPVISYWRCPEKWVLARIEIEAEQYFRDESDEEYGNFLALYRQLHRELALRLARRAAAHPNPEIQEVGGDYLTQLRQGS